MPSGGITITPGYQFGPSEKINNPKLNQLGQPVGRVDEGAIGERELDTVAVRNIAAAIGGNLFCNGNLSYFPPADDWALPDTITGVFAGGRKHDYAGPARWVVANDAHRTISREKFTPGQTDVPGAPINFTRWLQSSAVAGTISPAYFGQRMESVTNWSGRTLTFAIWVRSNVGINVTPSVRQFFGDVVPVVASADVVDNKTAVTLAPGAWTKVVATWEIQSVSGKTIVSGTTPANPGPFTEFRIVVPDGIAFTIDFAQAQLVDGPNEVAFLNRPFAVDLTEAQRYRQFLAMTLSDNLLTHGSPFINLPVKPRVGADLALGNLTLTPVSGTGGTIGVNGDVPANIIQLTNHSAIVPAKVFVDCELHAPA